MKVKTGFGYFKDKDNHIVSKYELPIGEHPLKDDYSYVEVATKEELNNIEIYEDPIEIQKQQKRIQDRINAINKLKNLGLTQDEIEALIS